MKLMGKVTLSIDFERGVATVRVVIKIQRVAETTGIFYLALKPRVTHYSFKDNPFMKKIILICLSLVYVQLVFGQQANGYYISKTGDTIRGKVDIPFKPKLKLGASSQTVRDPLEGDVPWESKDIDYSKLTFDFRFSENEGKPKKIDRLKVKGFGFEYNGSQYHFITWDVTANKQIYLIPATGDVVPDGVYFILHSVDGAFPVYSLFQEVEMTKRNLTGPPASAGDRYDKKWDGNAVKRDLVFRHPSKGFIYISDQYPLKMKFADALAYLGLENDFVKTLSADKNLLEVIKKYNQWKAGR